jgi:acyl dehydratase
MGLCRDQDDGPGELMEERDRSLGTYFEDFQEGQTMVSPSRTLTEADIVLFAGLSGDYNPLHCDAEFARESHFGQRIAHGLLGLAFASGLASRLNFIEGTALAFMGLEWRFRAPIVAGDTVHVVAKVASKRELRRMGGGVVGFDVRLVNQRGEAVQRGRWDILVRSGD